MENFEKQSPLEAEEEQFEKKKTRFFTDLGLRVLEVLRMHKSNGLWGEKGTREDWRNVSEHCLVEAARVEVFAEKLGLSEETARDLISAAALHDFYKKEDIMATKGAMKTEGPIWPALEEQKEKELKVMQDAGVDKDIIYIKEGTGGEKWVDELMLEILGKNEPLSERDVACLVLHYIDDYTRDAGWVEPAVITEGEQKINDLDRRVDKNEANPNYTRLNEESIGWFQEGETAFQAQRRIGHLVEKRIAGLLSDRARMSIDPLDLPELVDEEIRVKINSIK